MLLLNTILCFVYILNVTKEIDLASRNNIERFPDGYIFEIDKDAKMNWSKILTGSVNLNIYQHFQGIYRKRLI